MPTLNLSRRRALLDARAANAATLARAVALDATPDAELATPPLEFRLFTAGDVETTKGTFLFDADAAAAVLADAADWGNEFPVDYGHAMMDPKPVDPALSGKAAGHFRLEVRDGELWAVDVKWTPPAAEALRNREWKYCSPTFDFDRETGRIVGLINVALTNLPATKRMDPLMASKVTLNLLSAKLSASFDEIRTMVANAIRARFAPETEDPSVPWVGPWVSDLFDDHAVFEFEGHFYSTGYRLNGAEAELVGDAIEVRRTHEAIEGGLVLKNPKAAEPPETTSMQKLLAAVLASLALSTDATEEAALEAFGKMKAKLAEAPPAEDKPAADPAACATSKCASCQADLPAGAKFCPACGVEVKAPEAAGEAELPPAAMAKLAKERETSQAALAVEKKRADDATAELAKIRHAESLAVHVAKAEGLKALAQDPKTFGPVLLALTEKAPEEAKVIEALLAKANAALSASPLLRELGTGGDGDGSAASRLESLAKEHQKAEGAKGTKLSIEQARVHILKTQPEIHRAVQAETQGA